MTSSFYTGDIGYTPSVNIGTPLFDPGFDPLKFFSSPAPEFNYESGLTARDLGIDYSGVPSYSNIAFGTEPTKSAPTEPERPLGINDYIGAGAALTEAVADAVRAFKGYPSYTRRERAGEKLGRFLKETESKTEEGKETASTKNIKAGLASIFSNPDVLADIFNKPQITGVGSIDPEKLQVDIPDYRVRAYSPK